MAEIPWGQKESETLELKGRDALKDLFSIGREVVAMLNAKGGEIWVGVREEQSRAVAVEPIEKPDLERQRVRDYLVDSIEPRLGTEEVRIDEIGDGSDGIVFRLMVGPRDTSKPYALLRQTGRHFLRRFGDRVVTMSREEILRAHLGQGSEAPGARARTAAISAREKALAEGRKRLWLRIAPLAQPELRLQSPRLRGYLRNPGETANRYAGFHFAAFTQPIELKQGCLVGDEDHYSGTEITSEGAITSWVSLESLSGLEGGLLLLWPWRLIEYPTSVLRLARTVYRDPEVTQGAVDELLVDFAIFGLAGVCLKPSSPLYGRYISGPGREFKESADFLLTEPLRVTLDELHDGDRVAFRLLRQLYEAFGYYEEDIPPEFDRKTGRLVIPE